MNNIVKHARAAHDFGSMDQCSDEIVLQIRDDGLGSEPDDVEGGHLGIEMMHERAGNIGASLEILSHPGQGTAILVTWPGRIKEEAVYE